MSNETTTSPARALPAQFGPKPGWLRRDEINRQIRTLVGRFVLRAQAQLLLAHGLASLMRSTFAPQAASFSSSRS